MFHLLDLCKIPPEFWVEHGLLPGSFHYVGSGPVLICHQSVGQVSSDELNRKLDECMGYTPKFKITSILGQKSEIEAVLWEYFPEEMARRDAEIRGVHMREGINQTRG